MSEPLLEVRNLKKYFPVQHGMFSSGKGFVHAVDGVSLTVEKGETFGLVGESGCGKSSLSRVILGLVKRDSGDILYKGQDVRTLSRSERAKLRMVFQNPFASLNPKERVFDIIAEPYRIAGGFSHTQIQEEVLKLMDLVGLSRGYATRYPHEFSGGQRQRIGIARALAMNPEFIVCDEPVSALDVSIQAQILNLLRDIQKELGLTYVFISHNLGVVKYISDRIAVMYLGKIIEVSEAKDLYASPAHPYTQALLSAIPGAVEYLHIDRVLLQGDIPSPVNPPAGCRFCTRCPYAQERCATVEPEMRQVGEGHYAACHLVGKEAE
ncbi:oligopeptide/dipeptide ABC transporter ATP-binding protein [Flavonifractor sp. An100]|uniref:ABC transporter ATP-binding protein n=1 Tax=Flavonifractor sp. An100 TaxID=1965538 RepID=UPI000B379BAD|nr:oligopeptide/dipeptide ABC transporter ATP-binding protein [Flavonifractor sp. An100]OUQ76724.1 peptide ABC transporter substrate-binding protein [Flavonifractor sp. An100]